MNGQGDSHIPPKNLVCEGYDKIQSVPPFTS